MAFQTVPNTAKYAVVLSRGGVLMVNVFHFDREGLWGLNELQQGALYLASAYRNQVLNALHTSVILRRIEYRGLRAVDDFFGLTVPAEVVRGARSGDLAPGNVAFAIKHVTGRAGRSSRGRTFFGGFRSQDLDGDGLRQEIADMLIAALWAIRDGMSSMGWRMVVVSRRENKRLRPTGVVYPVTGFAYTDTTLDSQRRRLSGRGS